MNADEIVKELRVAAVKWEDKHKFIGTGELRVHDALNDAADMIESLQAQLLQKTQQLAASQRRAQDARNELCQKCGRYREAHNGACDGCRWKE